MPRAPRHRPRRSDRRGVLLLAVLVVVALLTIANLSYFDWAFTERRAADAAVRAAQARAAADSAVEMARLWLGQEAAAIDQDGGWYDNPARFRGLLVADGPAAELRGRAAVLAPRLGVDGPEGGRFGLEDESGRLNLNTLLVNETRQEGAGRGQLLALPGMTESIADAILDWLDPDDQTRSLGAERDYYGSLDPPYLPANGPLATVEQLLLVRDVTPEMLWGLDQDRNHEASASEAASITLPADDPTGELAVGWASLLTLHSAEDNFRPDGQPKINLNTDDLQQLHTDLESVLGPGPANFIVAWRQGGPAETASDPDADSAAPSGAQPGAASGAEPSEEAAEGAQPVEVGGLDGEGTGDGAGLGLTTKDAAGVSIDFNTPAAVAVGDPLDLVGVTVRVVEADSLEPVIVESPWREGDGSLATGLTTLLDNVSTTDAESVPGRININHAPRAVLAGVPGMPLGAVDAILANRDPTAGATLPDRLHATWLLSAGYVDLETMRAIAPYVCGRGAVFRGQFVGGFESGGPVARQEVALDTTKSPARVVMRRDLTPLGAGFDPAVALTPEGTPAAPAP